MHVFTTRSHTYTRSVRAQTKGERDGGKRNRKIKDATTTCTRRLQKPHHDLRSAMTEAAQACPTIDRDPRYRHRSLLFSFCSPFSPRSTTCAPRKRPPEPQNRRIVVHLANPALVLCCSRTTQALVSLLTLALSQTPSRTPSSSSSPSCTCLVFLLLHLCLTPPSRRGRCPPP